MNTEMTQSSLETLFRMVHQLKIVKILFLIYCWHHLNKNLGEDESTIFDHIEEKPIDGVDNQNIFIKPTRK